MAKHRCSWDDMAAAAGELVSQLRPACTRIAVAGSLRRGRPDPGDLELVAISDGRALHELTDAWLAAGMVAKRRKRNNTPIAWGDRYRAMIWRGMAVDLFVTTPPQWGLIMLLRTGPGTPDVGFERRWRGGANQMVVTPRRKGGLLPGDLRIATGWVWRGDRRLATPEESDVFRLLELPTIAPYLRDCVQYLHWQRAGRARLVQLQQQNPPALGGASVWPAVGWGAYDLDVVYMPIGGSFRPYSMAALVRMAERVKRTARGEARGRRDAA